VPAEHGFSGYSWAKKWAIIISRLAKRLF